MSNIRDTDILLVNRAGSSFHCSKANIGNVRDTDTFLVNRGGTSFYVAKSNVSTNVRDDDLVLVNRGGVSYKGTGADFKSLFVVKPGDSYEGGYFAGQINDGGVIYNLVVAPLVSGGLKGQEEHQWKKTQDLDVSPFLNEVYGRPATEAADSLYPGMWWIKTGADGPNAGTYDPTNATGTGIGGFNDWYMPAANELQIAYFFLKPTTQANDTNKGSIGSSVDPYLPFTMYGPGYPSQTTNPKFQEGGSESFSSLDHSTNPTYYWSATQWEAGAGDAYVHRFTNGYYTRQNKPVVRFVRAMRRVPA